MVSHHAHERQVAPIKDSVVGLLRLAELACRVLSSVIHKGRPDLSVSRNMSAMTPAALVSRPSSLLHEAHWTTTLRVRWPRLVSGRTGQWEHKSIHRVGMAFHCRSPEKKLFYSRFGKRLDLPSCFYYILLCHTEGLGVEFLVGMKSASQCATI